MVLQAEALPDINLQEEQHHVVVDIEVLEVAQEALAIEVPRAVALEVPGLGVPHAAALEALGLGVQEALDHPGVGLLAEEAVVEETNHKLIKQILQL